MKTIYKAEKYFLEITPIEIEFETDSFYREIGRGHKRAKNGSSYKCFNSNEEAVLFLQGYLESKVIESQINLNSNDRKLSEFNKKHGLL